MGQSRRRFIKGLCAGLAAAGVHGLGRRRVGAQSAGAPYPTIFIVLRGGVDPAMHFDARTGYVNRNVQAADIRETPGGIRWYEPVLAPMTNHIQDCTVIRNIQCNSSHINGWGTLWYGEGSAGSAAGAMPWAAYLSNQLLARQKVAAPNLVFYRTTDDQPLTDYIGFNNNSPSPLSAAQRVTLIQNLADGLDVLGGQPDPAFQDCVFAHIASMDGALYSPTVQGATVDGFRGANSQATELLTQPPPSVWPPEPATRDAFALTDGDLVNTNRENNQRFESQLALAYTMARLQLSHSIFVQSTNIGWDTHERHDERQRTSSAYAFSEIDRLITALKGTPSPIDATKSMLDTTHVVITSEISRANSADNGQDLDGTGTPHWPWTQAVLLGGNFKRDYAFGDVDANQQGVPADFNTGALNSGRVPTFKELIATVLDANGVDPAGWTTAPSIKAVLK